MYFKNLAYLNRFPLDNMKYKSNRMSFSLCTCPLRSRKWHEIFNKQKNRCEKFKERYKGI